MNEIELRATKKLIKLYEEMLTLIQEENTRMKRIYREMIELVEGAEVPKPPEEREEVKDLIQKVMMLKENIGV